MNVDERLALVTRNTMEVVNEDELRTVLETKEQPLAYIGFEPSGIVHMGWALVTAKIKDLCDAGFKVIILFCIIGAYGLHNNVFDVWTVLLFGAMGYVFTLLDIPPSPFILAPPLRPGSRGVWSAMGFFHPNLSATSRASMLTLLWSIPA